MKALMVVASVFALFTNAPSAGQAPGVCPVTTAPNPPFIAPAPYPANAPYRAFWYGQDKLWTSLPADGRWHSLPRNADGLRQKVFWWYPGFDGAKEPRPALTVTAKQLDGPAFYVHERRATNAHHPDFGGWTILTGIDVPNPGCWEFSGHYREQRITFVVKVDL
jgi:hypothetical protein